MSDPSSSPRQKSSAFWNWPLHWQVLIAILAGIVLGWVSGSMMAPPEGGIAGRMDMQVFDLIGGLFMNALKMLVVPLVMASIISAMSSMGGPGFARMGMRTMLFFVITSLIAILIGLLLVNWIDPGAHAGINIEEVQRAVQGEGSEAQKMRMLKERTAGKDSMSMLNVFRDLIPPNIFSAMANSQMLGLIFFSMLFGLFISRLDEKRRMVLQPVIEAIYEVIMKMTLLVLRFLPLGVLCLIAETAAETFIEGNVLQRLGQLSLFASTVLLGLGIHLFGVMPLLLIFLAKVSPVRHFKAISKALLTAFSTASSSATLPVTMECMEKRAGVSNRVSSFVLPLGATVNMDGTALYECVVVMFLAQMSGIVLGFDTQMLIVALALLTSIGVAGIPSASLVAIVIILDAVNYQLPEGQHIPSEALAIILVFDRLLDMCRTAVNIAGDTCCAAYIARSEGESILQTDPDEL